MLILIGYSIIAVPTGIYTAELASTMREAELAARRDARLPALRAGGHEPDSRHCRKCGGILPETFNS